MKTWFTADTHLGHTNIIRYCNRPFASVAEMDAAIIERWNARVAPDDQVYHLGDFALARGTMIGSYRKKLHGKITLIRGNHDKLSVEDRQLFAGIHELLELKLTVDGAGVNVVLCHYAMRVWPHSHHGAWHLYGHSHGTLPDDPHARSVDVGVDCWEFAPVSIQQLHRAMAKKLPRPVDHHGRHEALKTGNSG